MIVTLNLGDFPASALAPYRIEARHPDAFLVDLIEAAPAAVATEVTRQAADLRSPPRTVGDLLDVLGDLGLDTTAARLRDLAGQ
jgi:hypothetical protein